MGDLSPHFSRSEFACRCGCGFDAVEPELIEQLEALRAHFQAPVRITSGCRCWEHNKAVGGSEHSQHLTGRAADLVVQGVHADAVAEWLAFRFPERYGIGRYNGRTHFDVRPGKARWDLR